AAVGVIGRASPDDVDVGSKALGHVVVVVMRQPQLLEVVLTLGAAGPFACLLHCGEGQCGQKGAGSNDHPQFNERECQSHSWTMRLSYHRASPEQGEQCCQTETVATKRDETPRVCEFFEIVTNSVQTSTFRRGCNANCVDFGKGERFWGVKPVTD